MQFAAANRCFSAPDQFPAFKRPDWRDETAYRHLLGAEPALFAWEWLRRDAGYRRDFAAQQAGDGDRQRGARARGLCAYADPDYSFHQARPMWHRDAHPRVLPLSLSTGGQTGAIDLRPFLGRRLSVVAGRDVEHCLFTAGSASLRFDLHHGSLAAGPFVPRFLLEGAGAAALLPTLAQFLHMAETGDLRAASIPLHWSRRRMLELRTADALDQGICQREIAAVLIDADALGPEWRFGLSSVRSRAQRLVRASRIMECGGWAALLDRFRQAGAGGSPGNGDEGSDRPAARTGGSSMLVRGQCNRSERQWQLL